MKNILSPVTLSSRVKLFSTLKINAIVQKYLTKYNIDVSRFFKGLSAVAIYECKDSGYRFYYPKTIMADDGLYETLQKKLDKNYYFEWKLENQIAIENIQNENLVLDIGAGAGFFLSNAIKLKKVNAFGLEFNDLAIKKCRKKGLEVVRQTIQEHAKNNKEKYDAITAFQVLEHVYEVNEFISASISSLKKMEN